MSKSIKQLFFSQDLTDRACKDCSEMFNLLDWKNDNWDLEIKKNGNIDLSDFNKGSSKGRISIEVSLYHNDCPEAQKEPVKRQDHTI